MGIQWKHATAESPKWECRIGGYIKLSGTHALDGDLRSQVEKMAWKRRMVAMAAPDYQMTKCDITGKCTSMSEVKADLLNHQPTPEILESIGWA